MGAKMWSLVTRRSSTCDVPNPDRPDELCQRPPWHDDDRHWRLVDAERDLWAHWVSPLRSGRCVDLPSL